MKKKLKQNQCTLTERHGQLVFALNSEIMLPENAPVRLTSAQLEELDYEKLYRAYSPRGRKSKVDPLYEKVRLDGRIVSMAVLIVCGVDETGRRDIIAVEPMVEESRSSYGVLFQDLKDRGLATPKLLFQMHTPAWLQRFRSPSPEPPGSAARCISCGISWLMYRRKRRNLLLRC